MATVLKKCDCAKGVGAAGRAGRADRMKKWHRCPHSWKVMWRPGGSVKGQRTVAFNTWAEADAKKKQIEAAQANGERSKTDSREKGWVRFKTYAEERLEKWPGAKSSAKTYASSLRVHAYPVIGQKMLRDIDREDITDLVSDLKSAVDEQGKPLYAASTIAGVYIAIAAIFRQARLSKRVSESPCVEVKLPAVVSAAILIDPPMDQLLTFISRFPADWRLPSWFQYGCGLRIGEALALNANQFRDGGATYRVVEQVNPDGQIIPCKWRAEGEFRDVPVPGFVQEQYRQHIAFFPPDADGYVIPGRKHARVVRNSYLAHFRAAVEVAGLPDFMTSHYLRHRWASIMLARGVDITHVSRWLGHRQIQTTFAIYGHMVPTVAAEAREVMQAAFLELPGTAEGLSVSAPAGSVAV